jgi:hypothetical protein
VGNKKILLFIGEVSPNQAGVFIGTTKGLYEKFKSYPVSMLRCPDIQESRRASEIGNLAGLQLKLQFVSNQGNKFGIRGFSLGIADSIAEKSLQSIKVTTIPCNLNGMSFQTK